MTDEQLIELALKAREYSYSPYSGFSVGAALLCKDGTIYTGCNIENAAFTPGNCAERTAIFKAVSEGHKDFVKIAIVGGKTGVNIDGYAFPCGVCRQVMEEFVKPEEFDIIVGKNISDYKKYTLKELLPEGFGPESL